MSYGMVMVWTHKTTVKSCNNVLSKFCGFFQLGEHFRASLFFYNTCITFGYFNSFFTLRMYTKI